MAGKRNIAVAAADLTLDDDGIVVIQVRPVDVTVDQMRAVLGAQIELCPRPARVLVDARAVRSMSREAQELTAAPGMAPYTEALAILAASPVSVLLANFFVALVKPPFPTKLFRDEALARAWLLNRTGTP